MIAITEEEFHKFAGFVKSNYGIHFKDEKKTLVEGRLSQVLMRMNFKTLTAYMDYVQADRTGQAMSVMLDKITTNHTFFMREPAHFRYFQEQVLPFLEETVKDHDLRIWSAACSSGEEPYTLAMIIDEFFGSAKKGWDTKILATDISQKVLSAAKAGVYSSEKIDSLPHAWKRKYFREAEEGKSILSADIRNEVIFSSLNLMEERLPFRKKLHVIFCRNVMIYFDAGTKDSLVDRLYDITAPGGFLFIGQSESLNRARTRYNYVMPAVYRKE